MSQQNNHRFDLSKQLIHFFRDVNQCSTRPTDFVADFGNNNFVANDSGKWPALFLLRCAVRSQRLWATWSIRSNRRGVFGLRPAVCFSEMPLAAFLEASVQRETAGQAMSGYALTFSRDGMFKLGARPAIYGLSDGAAYPPSSKAGVRLMKESALPPREQYRYVPTNPGNSDKPIDWLHEREWRWPYSGSMRAYQERLDSIGHIPASSEMPHLDISGPYTKGMGIIVKTEDDAAKLAYDVLTLVDQGTSRPPMSTTSLSATSCRRLANSIGQSRWTKLSQKRASTLGNS